MNLLIYCALLICPAFIFAYSDPVLTPTIVQDGNGHTADQDDNITWNTDLPEGSPYIATAITNNKNVAGLYGMVNGFTKAVQPNDPPYELLSGLFSSGFDISGNTMTLVKFGAGIAVCMVLGLLFMILMPIVGCCFCCCRLCGRCGGKLKRSDPASHRPRDMCWCRAHTTMLLIVSIIMVSGCGLFVFSCGRMGDGFEHMMKATEDNFKDLVTYVGNIAKEVEYLVLDGYKFIVTVLKRDLDNMDYLVGLQIRNALDSAANIGNHFSDLLALASAVPSIISQAQVVKTSTHDIRIHGDALQLDLDAIRSTFQGVSSMSGCGASCSSIIAASASDINMDVDYSDLPDMDSNIALLDSIEKANLTASISQDMVDYYEIPERVKNSTEVQVDDMKTAIDDFSDTITKNLALITDLKSQVGSSVDGMTGDISQITSDIKTYKNYIWYGSIGVAFLLCLIIMLQLLGAFGAICYYDKDRSPLDRSKASHRMGNTLLGATGLAFIFSWLLMLMVFFPFCLGIILDRDVCDQMSGPDYPMIKALFDTPDGLLGEGYILGKMLLQDPNTPLTITGTLVACSKNESAYKALSLSKIIDLNETTDYKSLALDDDISAMTVNFSDIVLISKNTTDLLDIYKTAIDINYTTLQSVLATDIVKTDFTTLAANIRTVASDGTNTDPAKATLQAVANDLDSLEANEITDMEYYRSELLKEVNSLSSLTAGKAVTIDASKLGLLNGQVYLKTKTDDLLKDKLAVFQTRIFSVLDSFVDRVITGMDEDVGGCLPLYNFWTSLVENAICTQFVLPFNAVWFTLGWCVVFMIPSIIYSMKLSKYIRRMQYKKNKVVPIDVAPAAAPTAKSNDDFDLSYRSTRPPSRPPSYNSVAMDHEEDPYKYIQGFA